MSRKVERVWVLEDEYKDWRSLAKYGEKYNGIVVRRDRAFDYIHDEEDIDYDDYLIWYAKTHPGEEPLTFEILQNKDAMVEWFFNKGDWMQVRPLALIGGHTQ